MSSSAFSICTLREQVSLALRTSLGVAVFLRQRSHLLRLDIVSLLNSYALSVSENRRRKKNTCSDLWGRHTNPGIVISPGKDALA